LQLFLDLDDGFGTRQAQRETGIVSLKTGNFVGQRVGVTGLRAAFAGTQCAERSGVALLAPFSEGRRVEPFATQDGADSAGLSRTISIGQDA
jgi:hypothetical protein